MNRSKTTWGYLLSLIAFAVLPNVTLALSSSDFVILSGTNTDDRVGRSVASGDVNGDGYDDLITGSPNNATAAITIVYGSSTVLSSTTLSTSNSSIITGNGSTDYLGANLAIGDINGDGYADIAASATGDTTGGAANSGAIYIIYGQADALTSGALSGLTNSAKFYGGFNFVTGTAVDVGDINGDGYDDVVFGSTNDASAGTGGSVSIIYGSTTNYSGSSAITALPKFTAEAANDYFGTAVAVGNSDADAYEDIIVGASNNDSGGDNAGAVYLIYGQSTSFSGSNSVTGRPEWYGEAASDEVGKNVLIADTNADGNGELVVSATGNDDGATSAGAVYVVAGTATQQGSTSVSLSTTGIVEFTGAAASDEIGNLAFIQLSPNDTGTLLIGSHNASSTAGVVYLLRPATITTGGGVATVADATITGNGTETFGRSIAGGDLNGDNYNDLLVGANMYSPSGAAMVGYLYIDADLDGMPGTSGLFTTIDLDTVYDTNDAIPNGGIEISDTGIDEDGDGTVDEVNTVSENGAHPYYSTFDPTDTTTTEVNITHVAGAAAGAIEVTFADNSMYSYPVFNTTTTKRTKTAQYNTTGYAVALQRKGKSAKLVNLYSGDSADSQKLNAKGASSASLLLGDVRKDDSTDAVVTTKKSAKVKVYLMQVKMASAKLKLKDTAQLANKKIVTRKTQIKKSTVRLRSNKNKILERLTVTKKYTFSN